MQYRQKPLFLLVFFKLIIGMHFFVSIITAQNEQLRHVCTIYIESFGNRYCRREFHLEVTNDEIFRSEF